MSDLIAAGGLPDVHAEGGPGFMALASSVTVLTTQALALKERLGALQRRMEANSDRARDYAEKAGAAEVDQRLVALMLEAADAVRAVAEASGELSRAADLMQTEANNVNAAHETEYRGVYEAVQASAYDQPKPGFLQNR